MRRVIFGVIWFIVFIIVLNFIYGIVLGVSVTHHAGLAASMDRQQMMGLMQTYRQQHALSMDIWRSVILLVSLALSIAGSLMGILPGTRKKKIVVPVQ